MVKDSDDQVSPGKQLVPDSAWNSTAATYILRFFLMTAIAVILWQINTDPQAPKASESQIDAEWAMRR